MVTMVCVAPTHAHGSIEKVNRMQRHMRKVYEKFCKDIPAAARKIKQLLLKIERKMYTTFEMHFIALEAAL